MDIYQLLAQNLKNLLMERDWTVKELSKRSGIGEKTIKDIMQAKRKKIRFNTLYGLCVTLKTTMKELVGF